MMNDDLKAALTHSLGVEFDRLIETGTKENSTLGKRILRILRGLPEVLPADSEFVQAEQAKYRETVKNAKKTPRGKR